MTQITDYINNLADPKDQRAVQAAFDNFGEIVPNDSIKQSQYDRDYVLEEFETCPIVSTKDTGGAPTGTTGDENLLMTEDNILEYHILGTQTIVAPVMSASGLNIAMDQTDDDGVELCAGILANNRQAFVVGASKPFFFEAEIAIGDVSGTDDCAVGFRKVEAYQANLDDYDELACLNVISGDIKIETILNNGDTTTTDTTDNWADLAKKKLRIDVDANGVVTYKIDGVAPTVTAAFSFDADEVVVPFIYMLNAAHLVDTLYVTKWECGLS